MIVLHIIAEFEDFEVLNELNQTFLSGGSNGSLCLSIESLLDSAVEDPEELTVSISSHDSAAMITEGTARVTIVDANNGRGMQ